MMTGVMRGAVTLPGRALTERTPRGQSMDGFATAARCGLRGAR